MDASECLTNIFGFHFERKRKEEKVEEKQKVESTSIYGTAGQEHNTIKNDQIYKVQHKRNFNVLNCTHVIMENKYLK